METQTTDILVVGGGTGGTAAAIQAARRGLDGGTQVIVVSEFSWLGGMLTAAGVSAPDGNELRSLQTGLWGQFIQTVQQQQPGGVDHGWVSCFTYDPKVGAAIFADWVQSLPNLHWISGQRPVAVERKGDRLTGVTFDTVHINASIILDGTELGDVLALGNVPHQWGWDGLDAGTALLCPMDRQAKSKEGLRGIMQSADDQHKMSRYGNGPTPSSSPLVRGRSVTSHWNEPSAPNQPNALTQTYPVQLPTWVVVMQDFGPNPSMAIPDIPPSPLNHSSQFAGAYDGYGLEHFLNYGRLPGDRFMINWPQQGNDYGKDLDRLVQSEQSRQEWLQEARWHTQDFSRYIQQQVQQHLGRRYGLATDLFPNDANSLGGGAYALYPYYRESRRLQGLVTVTEQNILPLTETHIAPLPVNDVGEMDAIAIGNYANDHHYPAPESRLLSLKSKSMEWGGRWTGTPFALPYRCLVPATVDGLLACDKNISVSHIANGSTRLQPVVMNLGQAAGMAAALCIEHQCQPRDLPVLVLQKALLTDAIAPAAVIPLLDIAPDHPDWLQRQYDYLAQGDVQLLSHSNMAQTDAAQTGILPTEFIQTDMGQKGGHRILTDAQGDRRQHLTGEFQRVNENSYVLVLPSSMIPPDLIEKTKLTINADKKLSLPLITLEPSVHRALQQCPNGATITVIGPWNPSGPWMRVEHMILLS
ncbi:MAG: FAD-dependent oxidoreductase [Merismopedia sp. SIO2A8]|nr:FAD-dependent oxidoreductase [Symploca sp. SIO2B6]NET48145.1 FAD-dependent oxidoreductase [Merismopedia sp. SIO2A8]